MISFGHCYKSVFALCKAPPPPLRYPLGTHAYIILFRQTDITNSHAKTNVFTKPQHERKDPVQHRCIYFVHTWYHIYTCKYIINNNKQCISKPLPSIIQFNNLTPITTFVIPMLWVNLSFHSLPAHNCYLILLLRNYFYLRCWIKSVRLWRTAYGRSLFQYEFLSEKFSTQLRTTHGIQCEEAYKKYIYIHTYM